MHRWTEKVTHLSLLRTGQENVVACFSRNKVFSSMPRQSGIGGMHYERNRMFLGIPNPREGEKADHSTSCAVGSRPGKPNRLHKQGDQ